MKIEDNRENEDRKFVKDIEVGECFEDCLGEIAIRTDEEHNGNIRGLNIRNGALYTYNVKATVKPVNARVVIE